MASQYEPLRIFDAPDVLFTQLLQGEISGRSIKNTLLRPNNLSIEERDSFADDLKESMGNTNVGNALVDLAKNPFFWLLFMTSPLGGRVLSKGKTVLFEAPERLSAYVKENDGLLGMLRALTGNEYYSGTAAPAALGGLSRELEALHSARRRIIQKAYDDFAATYKVKRGFDPAAYPDDPVMAQRLEKLNMGLFGALGMRHVNTPQRIATAYRKFRVQYKTRDTPVWREVDPMMEGPVKEIRLDTPERIEEAASYVRRYNRDFDRGVEPPFEYRYVEPDIEIDELTRRGWGGDDPFEVLESIGATPILKAYQQTRRDYYIRQFLKPWGAGMRDSSGVLYEADELIRMPGMARPYVVDEEKLLKVWRAHKNKLFREGNFNPDDPVPARGLQMLREMMSQEASGMLRGGLGTMEWDEFLHTARRIIRDTTDYNTYVPRNVVEVLGEGLRTLDPESVAQLKLGEGFFASSRTIPRAARDVRWHPDDLERYARVMNVPENSPIWREIQKARSDLNFQVARDGQAAVHRIDPIEAMERYMKDMDETTALFISRPSKELLDHQDMYFKRSKSPWVHQTHGPVRPRLDPDTLENIPDVQPAKIGKTFRETEAEVIHGVQGARVPLGGFNYADALWAEYNLFNNARARDILTNVMMPTILGRMSSANQAGLMTAALFKQAAQGFMATPLKGLFDGAGRWGKAFTAKMQRAAELPLDKMWTSRDIANYLYVAHLGINMSSVMLNLMQPLLLGVPWLGGRAIWEGYKRAIGEMGDYIKVRSKMPLRISDMDRDSVTSQVFKWGGRETGDDLLDIQGTIFHTVDAVAEGKTSFRKPGWRRYLTMEAPMKMFEKAEWMNRLVMSHAAEYAVRARGITDPTAIARNVHDMIRQTQYGAHVMNTPIFMLPYAHRGGRAKNWLSDPTMRQFMMFPLRTLTGFVYGPQLIAGDYHHPAKAVLGTWARALGVGAIAHSILKNMVGADMSRGLAPYAPMDIFQGDRFIEGTEGVFPLMIPPVIDITSGFAAWALGDQDKELMQRWLSRSIPGGVGLRRGLGLIPNVDTDYGLGRMARSLQSHYVDWGAPRVDGMVPVMKADGTLVRYAKPGTMILRALGMDMRKFASEAEVDRWLSKNRDDFSKMRREFITSVLNSDWRRADQLQAQSKKKYGIPIRFSRSQLQSQMRTRTITRTERLLDRMSPDLRERYIQAIQHKAPELGLTPEQLGQPTASKRTEAGAQRPTPLTPEAERYLRGIMTQDPRGVFSRYRE
jgi:hypothetical protein